MGFINAVLLIWNALVMLFYGLDKSRALRATRRIRERSLLFAAFLLGGLGAMFGMVVFNHKTSKMRFRITVPLCAVLTLFVHFVLYCKI